MQKRAKITIKKARKSEKPPGANADGSLKVAESRESRKVGKVGKVARKLKVARKVEKVAKVGKVESF